MFAKHSLNTRKTWLLTSVLVLSLLAALLPLPVTVASAAATPKCGTPYIVKNGDTLAKIGTKFDVSSYAVVEGNKLSSPYTIYVGQKLCISEKSSSKSLSSKYANAQAAYFTAWFWTDGIYVQPYHYPKTTVWVKGDNAGDQTKNFIKIGRLNTVNTDNNKVHFVLPSDLSSSKSLWVCLKDITTDYNQCVYIPPKL